MYSPNHDYREIQQVPAVAEVSSWMRDEAVSYDLHHALHRKNHKKNVLYLLLQHQRKNRREKYEGRCTGVDRSPLKEPLRKVTNRKASRALASERGHFD